MNGNKSEVENLRSRIDDVVSTCEVNENEPTQPNEKEEESSGQGNFDDSSENRNDEAFEDDEVCRELSPSVKGCSGLNECKAEALHHSSVSQLGPLEMEKISDISDDAVMENEVSNMRKKVDVKHPPSIGNAAVSFGPNRGEGDSGKQFRFTRHPTKIRYLA